MAPSLGPTLVIGGCGFVGHNIIHELLRQDPSASISVLDLRTETNVLPSVTYYAADITQKSQVEAVFAKVKPKTVFHTVSPPPLQDNPSLLHKVNIDGTQNLLACAQKAGTVAFVYTSSTAVVHDHYSPLRDVTEDAPVLFHPQQPEPYAHTKAVGESLVLQANSAGSMLTVAIRPTTIYGEGDLLVTAQLCKTAYTGKAKFQFGDGKNLNDTTYVGNLAYAEVLAAQALVAESGSASAVPEAKRVQGEVFFVRNDERYPFWEINRMVSRIAGYPVRKEEVWAFPRWLVMSCAFLVQWLVWAVTFGQKEVLVTPKVVRLVTMDRTFSIDKIKERLGYRPRFSTEEGLQRAVGWYMREVYGGKERAQ